jgi:hypothetical protein
MFHDEPVGRSYPVPMHLEFSGELWFWKGPAPWHFVTVPEEGCGELEATSAFVSYGWGMSARLGAEDRGTSPGSEPGGGSTTSR